MQRKRANCGYEGGGVELPRVPVRATVDPVQTDAGATIQNAIDEVSALPLDRSGLRGAVLLKRGSYRLGGNIPLRKDGGKVVQWAPGSKNLHFDRISTPMEP